jgi:hypothetical protein
LLSTWFALTWLVSWFLKTLQEALHGQAPQQGHHQQEQQHSQLPPISDLLPRSQRNTTSSGGFVISTAPDEVIEGFRDSLRFNETLNLDLSDTLGSGAGATSGAVCEGEQQQQRMRHRAVRSSAGYAPTWGYASDSSSDEGQQVTPRAQRSGAYSDSSTSSSPLIGHGSAAAVDRSSQLQQLSFVGAFDHLEVAAEAAAAGPAAAAAEGEYGQAGPNSEFSLSLQQQLRRSSAGGIGRGEPLRASFSSNAAATASMINSQQQQQQQRLEPPVLEESPAPAPAVSRRAAAGDHVVTWYSAVGGSIDFGSPEPPSPQGEESFKATAMLRAAGRSAAARMAAAASVDAAAAAAGANNAAAEALQYDSEKDGEEQFASGLAAAAALAAEASAAASSSSSSRQRRRWDLGSQQAELQQAEQREQQVVAMEGDEALPRWSTRPSWAAAGLGGYRCAAKQLTCLAVYAGVQQVHGPCVKDGFLLLPTLTVLLLLLCEFPAGGMLSPPACLLTAVAMMSQPQQRCLASSWCSSTRPCSGSSSWPACRAVTRHLQRIPGIRRSRRAWRSGAWLLTVMMLLRSSGRWRCSLSSLLRKVRNQGCCAAGT